MAGQVVPVGKPEDSKVTSVVAAQAASLQEGQDIIRFRHRAMVLVRDGFPHYVALTKEHFDSFAYELLGGQTRSRMGDVFAYVCNTAEDLSAHSHLIGFGSEVEDTVVDAYTDLELLHKHRARVWDTTGLTFTSQYRPDQTVWRSPYRAIRPTKREKVAFVMSLAGGDDGLYDDIMQSMAPLIMERKPDGVIWWVGDGANGKSTLMDALYRLFPGQLSSLTVKSLTDGRDTPSLNGHLANVVKESSEGRIDDTEVYKSIGTHEDFTVHKFHSQESVTIKGNMHHIFSGNSIPAFNDKGFSARRRTFIIPFNERFESDPLFEKKTFTSEMFGLLISEMMHYARQIERQGYRYKWSAKTLGAKASYDSEANNAEEYSAHLVASGVVAFDTFMPVRMDYENWCLENAVTPLGVANMRRALQSAGFTKCNVRISDRWSIRYRLPGIDEKDLQPFSMGRPGLYTASGFRPQEDIDAEAEQLTPKQTEMRSEW